MAGSGALEVDGLARRAPSAGLIVKVVIAAVVVATLAWQGALSFLTVKSQIAAVETRATAVEAAVASDAGRIRSLESNKDTMGPAVAALTIEISKLGASVTDQTGKLIEQTVELRHLKESMQEVRTRIDARAAREATAPPR